MPPLEISASDFREIHRTGWAERGCHHPIRRPHYRRLFHDASLYYNGSPISSITETIFNLANNAVIGTMLVTNPPIDFTDDIILAQDATNIRVVKDIAFQGVGTQS